MANKEATILMVENINILKIGKNQDVTASIKTDITTDELLRSKVMGKIYINIIWSFVALLGNYISLNGLYIWLGEWTYMWQV